MTTDKEQSMLPLYSPDMPATYFRHPNPTRGRAALVTALDMLGTPSDLVLMAALYSADLFHMVNYGRPIYGEVWIKTPRGAHGVYAHAILRTLLGKMRPVPADGIKLLEYSLDKLRAINPEALAPDFLLAKDVLSETDQSAIRIVGYFIKNLRDEEIPAFLAKNAPYNRAEMNQLIDWRYVQIDNGAPEDSVNQVLEAAAYTSF